MTIPLKEGHWTVAANGGFVHADPDTEDIQVIEDQVTLQGVTLFRLLVNAMTVNENFEDELKIRLNSPNDENYSLTLTRRRFQELKEVAEDINFADLYSGED